MRLQAQSLCSMIKEKNTAEESLKKLLSALLVIALLFINTLALAGCDIGFSEDGDTLEEDLGKPEDGEETDSDNGGDGSQEENKNLYDKKQYSDEKAKSPCHKADNFNCLHGSLPPLFSAPEFSWFFLIFLSLC